MSLILDGTNGLSDVDGSAATPAIRGSDANTGVFFGADQVGIATNGVERVEFGNSETVFNDGGANLDFRVEGDTDANLLFVDASAEAVLVGATSQYFLNNKATISQTSSTSSGSALAVATEYVGDVGNAAFFVAKNDNNSTTSQVFVRFLIDGRANATASGQINANGAAQAAFGSWSDRRLKKNIVDLPPQLSNIMALRPVEFDYIESEGGGHQIGFVAQELQDVYADAVGERSPDGMLTVTGWSKTEARLVAAIQELKGINDAQAQIITALTARVEALEGAQA
jgi:hypothetical protein